MRQLECTLHMTVWSVFDLCLPCKTVSLPWQKLPSFLWPSLAVLTLFQPPHKALRDNALQPQVMPERENAHCPCFSAH